MSYKKATKPLVHLPRVPVSPKADIINKDEFWQQKGASGAINAFRQLTSTLRRGGRKVTLLPGGKLQPLFKNDSNPDFLAIGPKNVLPNISKPSSDLSPLQKHIVCGNLEDLPELSPTTVKIYLCSNYQDMKHERMHLLRTAVPELESYCNQLGLQFQLVDLHWGVGEDTCSWEAAAARRQVQQHEIASCQRDSVGPHFVCLLGDKYGVPQLPASLTDNEYQLLHNLATENKLDNVELFSQFYPRDENAVPVAHVFQKPSELDHLRHLECVMQQVFELAVSQHILTQERCQELTMSALEMAIRKGIMDRKDPRSHCLCYHREFREIKSDVSLTASTYIDITADATGTIKLNSNLNNRIQKLSEGLAEHLGVGNFHDYYLDWTVDPLEGDSDFQAYLVRMTEDFIKDIKEMVDTGYSAVSKEIGVKRSVIGMVQQEALFHITRCKEVISDYSRSTESELFTRLRQFLTDPKQNNKPFVVYGESGSGKTTTMGVITQQLKTWFSADCVVVLRFLGSSWHSANMHQTVTNITLQICMAYDIPVPTAEDAFSTMYQTLITFRSVLDKVSRDFACTHPLFIVMDGIDQLHPYQESLKALWAMQDFPPNVHMIISVVPQIGPLDLLGALTSMLTSEDAAMEVPALSEEEIQSFARASMEKCKRKLSESQVEVFTEVIKNNPQSLFIHQLMLQALRSHSSLEVVSSEIPKNVEGLFAAQIERIELEIGAAIVQHFVAFITAAPVGILERELLDLLTYNKEVMEEVYMLHHKPSQNIFLFPQELLSILKLTLQDFLCEHLLFGNIALAWNHREVYEAASKCYDIVYPGINETEITEEATNFSLTLHEQYANMFLPDCRTELMCELAEVVTDVTSTQVQLHQVQDVMTANTQKLHRLLTHLIIMVPVEGLSRIKECVLFNFHWLFTKLQSMSLAAIVQDVVHCLLLAKSLERDGVLEEENHWEELDILLHFLQLARPAISQDAENLAVEIIGRLPQIQDIYPGLCGLVDGAREHLAALDKPHVVPLHGCLTSPGGDLRYTFPEATHVVGFTYGSGLAVMFSQNNGVSIWKLDSTELLQHFPVNKEQATEGVIPGHHAPIIVIGHYSHLNHVMEIGAWHVDTGVAVVQTNLPQKFEAIALGLDDQVLFLATTIQEEVVTNGNSMKRCILGINAKTKDVVCTLLCDSLHSDCVKKMMPVRGVKEGEDALISLGGTKSKDLIYWNVGKAKMEYCLKLEYFLDMFELCESKYIGIGCSKDEGIIMVLELHVGSVQKTMHNVIFRDAQDVYVSQGGEFILVATCQDGVIMHDITNDTQMHSPVKRLAEDGKTIVKPSKITMDDLEQVLCIGYQSGLIDIYSLFTGQPIKHVTMLSSHTKTINTLHTLDGDQLLSASDNNEAKLWNYGPALQDQMDRMADNVDDQVVPERGDEPTKEKMNNSHDISCLIMTRDEKTIITGSYNGPIRMWNTEKPDVPTREITDKCEHGIADLYLAYKQRLLIGHCINPDMPTTRLLQVWNYENGEPIRFDQDVLVRVYTSSTFPSDDRILTISPSTDDRQKGIIVAIFDLFEMKCLASLHCNIYGNMDCTNLRLLGFTTAPQSEDLDVESLHSNGRSSTEFTLNGAHQERQYAVLDYFPAPGMSFFFTFVIHGREMKDISMDHHEPIHLDTLSPKCTMVMPKNVCISGMMNGSLILWNAASQTIVTDFCDAPQDRSSKRRREANRVEIHDGPVTCLAAAPDNVHVVSGGTDGKVKMWNVSNKTLVHTFTRHTKQILDVYVSRGNVLVSSSMDNTVTVCDIPQTKHLCSYYAHSHVTDVSLTTDNSRLVARVNKDKANLLVLKLANL